MFVRASPSKGSTKYVQVPSCTPASIYWHLPPLFTSEFLTIAASCPLRKIAYFVFAPAFFGAENVTVTSFLEPEQIAERSEIFQPSPPFSVKFAYS